MSALQEVPYGSNAIRLSPREWCVAVAAILACFVFVPKMWERLEPLNTAPDFRMPYKLSSDYWLYGRLCRSAAAAGKTLVVGDSVVWGQYVAADQTLSHYLGARAAGERFANLGMDGMHPAALAGLLKYYGQAISGRKVLVQCNLLWMSSVKHDLRTDKEFRFNHPDLVPQFFPRIPCYTEPASTRLSVVVERSAPFFPWACHLRVAYFGSTDIPSWTMEHPYECPLSAIAPQRLLADEKHKPKPALWTGKAEDRQDFPWVELEASFQWRSFQRAISILQGRGNKVFVLVGPFNEHMMTESSLSAYRKLKDGIDAGLTAKGIPHFLPPTLPSECYADASHPLARGYEMLAREVLECKEWSR